VASKTQIDKLGERLKVGAYSESDLRDLDEYRRSFGEAFAHISGSIHQHLHLNPSGRPEKSTGAIVEKLRRESVRLSQVQDIAGCRIVVPTVHEQNHAALSLLQLFPCAVQVDRRKRPSHGYRAVHVIAKWRDKLVEIQVRTFLQQAWAEASELAADLVDPSLKYGRGPEEFRLQLVDLSRTVADIEEVELHVSMLIDRSQKADAERGLRLLMTAFDRRYIDFLRGVRTKGAER
jgi:putative GTP pyrophosphokinase